MTRKPKPVNLGVRLPVDLYQAIDVYAETEDVNLSEALRRLLVQALDAQGMKHTVTDAEGTREDSSWREPLAPEDQD